MGSSTGCSRDICCTMVLSIGCRISAPPSSPPLAAESILNPTAYKCFLSLLPFLCPWCLQGFSHFFPLTPLCLCSAFSLSHVITEMHYLGWWAQLCPAVCTSWSHLKLAQQTLNTFHRGHPCSLPPTQQTLLKMLIVLYRPKRDNTDCTLQPCPHFGKKDVCPSRDCTTWHSCWDFIVSASITIKASWVT